MKRALILLINVILILCAAQAACAVVAPDEDFSRALNALTGKGGSILSASQCGCRGAAVIEKDGLCSLWVLCRENGEWQTCYENKQAVCGESTVVLDTDDMLILTNPFPWYDGYHEQFYFTYDGDWVLSSVIRYETDEWNEVRCPAEHIAALSEGKLETVTCYTDEEGNILLRRAGITLPDVLTREERLLRSFDGTMPPFDGLGYFTDESGDISAELAKRLFDSILPEGYQWVDGILTGDGLQFIADRADGSRVLLCCAPGAENDAAIWQITESTPLPGDTTIGIENFTHTLFLGTLPESGPYGVNVGRNIGGTWGITYVCAKEFFSVGPCWVSDGGLWWNAGVCIGTTPWNDIRQIDWSSVPLTLNEAKARLDPSLWATPDNPNPGDRLHLRAEPKKDSASLGKYYNGTPLKVLERGTEWTKVQIGGKMGYMMTAYLAFGQDLNARPTALTGKQNLHPLTEILWDDSSEPEMIPGYEVSQLVITGVIGDEWYLVWNPDTGRTGQIRQTELWDGNG